MDVADRASAWQSVNLIRDGDKLGLVIALRRQPLLAVDQLRSITAPLYGVAGLHRRTQNSLWVDLAPGLNEDGIDVLVENLCKLARVVR